MTVPTSLVSILPPTCWEPSTQILIHLRPADNIAEPMIWSVLECTISIITISIPPMRPLFAKLAPGIFVANVAEDHKKLTGRISRRLPGFQGAFSRMPSSSKRSAFERKSSAATNHSSSTVATETEAWAGREYIRVIREETIVEEKV